MREARLLFARQCVTLRSVPPLPTCTTAKVLFTRQRYTTLLCRARSKKSYQHGTDIISACLVTLAGVFFVRQRDSSATVCNADGRYPHGKVSFCPLPGAKSRKLSARHGPIFYLPWANRMSIIRTGAEYNADGLFPHGKVLFCPFPCAKSRELSARHGYNI